MKKTTTNATTNAIVTTNKKQVATKTNATKTNATKTNEKPVLLTVSEITEILQQKVFGSDNKVYTDHKFYSGFGKNKNTFSVNAKKTKYNVYCSDKVFSHLTASKIDGVNYIANGNSTDKTRPNYIECTTTENLLKLVSMVL